MSCNRARRIDVEKFLVESGVGEFASFRTHFPTCPDCAAAVARWTAFERALHSVPDANGQIMATHVAPDRLELFQIAPETMGDEAIDIENHLSRCDRCRTELAVLSRFESDFLPAVEGDLVVTSLADRRARHREGLFDRLRSGLAWPALDLGATAPALAAAALVILGIWWAGVFDRSETLDPHPETTQIARDDQESRSAPNETEAQELAAVRDPQDVEAEVDEGRSASQEERSTLPNLDRIGEPQELAQVEITREGAEKVRPSSDPKPPTASGNAKDLIAIESPDAPGPLEALDSPTATEDAAQEEILLAALTELPTLRYNAPAGAESLGWNRQLGAVRSGPESVHIETRAPATHVGLTLSEAPRLWWYASRDTDLPVQFTIVDDQGTSPLLRVDLTGPFAKGLHSIDLAKHGVRLSPDVEYRWFVALIVDADRPSRNPMAGGALRQLPASDLRRAEASQASPAERGHTLARLGIWYDAYDFFASIAAAHPESDSVARQRERLAELAGARFD